MPNLVILGICTMTLGALALGGVFLDGRNSTGVHIIAVAFLALAVTLILGGLQTVRWGVSAEKGRVREELFTEDLFSIETGQAELIEKIRDFLKAEATQSARSKEARDRLERVERVLLVLAAQLEGAADFGDRLHAIERNLDTLARASRETAQEQSKEASAVEVRLDSLARQLAAGLEMIAKISLEMPDKDEIIAEVRVQVLESLRAEMADALKEARALGFVDALDGRGGGNVRRLPGSDQR